VLARVRVNAASDGKKAHWILVASDGLSARFAIRLNNVLASTGTDYFGVFPTVLMNHEWVGPQFTGPVETTADGVTCHIEQGRLL
jgi:hypothetical protein